MCSLVFILLHLPVDMLVLLLLPVHLLIGDVECSIAPDKGPPERKKEVDTVVTRPGEDVRLICPVYGSPQPIIEWSKVN